MKRLHGRVVCALALLFALLLGCGVCVAQSSLTVDDIVKLSKAGLGEDVIIDKVKKNGKAFDLSTDQLIELKGAGVSDKVVRAMMSPADAAPQPSTGKTQMDANDPGEVGVYSRRTPNDPWVEVLPEVINWKTGGFLKSLATNGIVKGDVNGHLNGKSSKNVANTATEFLIIAQEGVAITEYQLLRLRENGDNREFRTVTGGVFHTSGGATRDAVEFEGKKVSPRHYLVRLPNSVRKGEYGFLPPGAVGSANAASQGKLYSFQVVE